MSKIKERKLSVSTFNRLLQPKLTTSDWLVKLDEGNYLMRDESGIRRKRVRIGTSWSSGNKIYRFSGSWPAWAQGLVGMERV